MPTVDPKYVFCVNLVKMGSGLGARSEYGLTHFLKATFLVHHTSKRTLKKTQNKFCLLLLPLFSYTILYVTKYK